MIKLEILAAIGAIYILIDAIKLTSLIYNHYKLGDKWKQFVQNTILYREYEIHRFRKFHYKQWETFDNEKLCHLELMLTRHPRYKRNKYTSEYLLRVRELQKRLEDRNLEEWNP